MIRSPKALCAALVSLILCMVMMLPAFATESADPGSVSSQSVTESTDSSSDVVSSKTQSVSSDDGEISSLSASSAQSSSSKTTQSSSSKKSSSSRQNVDNSSSSKASTSRNVTSIDNDDANEESVIATGTAEDSSVRKSTEKNITDYGKLAARYMFIPIVLILASIYVLVSVNVKAARRRRLEETLRLERVNQVLYGEDGAANVSRRTRRKK